LFQRELSKPEFRFSTIVFVLPEDDEVAPFTTHFRCGMFQLHQLKQMFIEE